MSIHKWQNKLTTSGLRVTPQRLAVLEAFAGLDDHPTAERIISYVHENHPNIAPGTVYKILEVFVEKGIILKVKTDRDFVRYDAVTDKHHHLYSSESDKIEDYFDEELDGLLQHYFSGKNIPGFEIEEVKLQIKGKFK